MNKLVNSKRKLMRDLKNSKQEIIHEIAVCLGGRLVENKVLELGQMLCY